MNRVPLPTRLWRAVASAWRGEPVSRRSYAAAGAHRLLADWPGTAQSADKATRYQGKALRFRARELRENSPIVARYAALVRDNVIGPDGITLQAIVPTSRGTSAGSGAKIEAAWYKWAASCTPDGQSWIEVCGTIVESWKIEGEALLELIPSAAAPSGLFVKALDADLLDEQLNLDRTPRGGSVVQGIEYDVVGRVVGYHLLTAHPSDGGARTHRVLPANRLLYLGHRSRPQQARGVTALAPVMLLLQHLEKTDEAIVVLNRVTASKMGALIPGADAQPLDGDGGIPPQIEQAPGEWWTLPQGWDVKMLDPGQPTQEYDVFARHLLRKIASGLHVAYASLTGDLSDVNYSSMRAGLLVERDAWQGAQTQFIATIVAPVFRLWLDTAPMLGAFAMPTGQNAETIAEASVWHPRRWPWVDPLKDANAIGVLLSLGLTTRTREANKQGLSFSALVDERAEEEAYLEAKGVDLGTADAADTTPDPADATNAPPAAPVRPLRAIS
jgi:lambda family phage portal protein